MLPGFSFRLTLGLVVVLAAVSALVSASAVGGPRFASEASGLIAFARADGLYVMRTDGSGVRRVMGTVRTPLYGGVAWSPDGSKLVFATWNGIWVMDASGRERVRLATGGDVKNYGSPTWSADGRRIAFTAYQGDNRDIWVMNTDGSDQQRLKKTPGLFEGEVDWSPAGGWLVFDSGGWVSDVYVVKTNGSNLRNLTPGEGWVGSGQPGWSPDGRRIVFARPSGIWVMDASGRSQTQLTSEKGGDGVPDWSPDGRKIAFVRKLISTKETSQEIKETSSEIYVINADGTGLTRLTHNHVAEANPTWQPVAAP